MTTATKQPMTTVTTANVQELYMRYLGTLGLLAEVSVYLPNNDEGEEMRQQLIEAFTDAENHHPLRWRRILNRLEIYPYDHGVTP